MIDVMFDHQIFVTQRYGGVSRYFFELAKGLDQIQGMRTAIVAPFHINGYLHAAPAGGLGQFHFPYLRRGLRYRVPALAPVVRAVARWKKPDVLHETSYEMDRGCAPGAKVVATLHDMTVEKFPDSFHGTAPMRSGRKLAALRRADHVICVSENSRRDLLEMFPEFSERASVVYHGVTAPVASRLPMPGYLMPYLLFVGTRGGYKNFTRFFSVYSGSQFLKSNFGLVLFGGGPLNQDEQAMVSAARLAPGRLVQTEGDERMLNAAYQWATALVFPSLYEGFGLPLIEAMANGCPVVCSRASSFPEIGQDAVAYFDPTDSEEMRETLERVLGDSDALASLARRGRECGARFTWARCVAETAAVYRSLLGREA